MKKFLDYEGLKRLVIKFKELIDNKASYEDIDKIIQYPNFQENGLNLEQVRIWEENGDLKCEIKEVGFIVDEAKEIPNFHFCVKVIDTRYYKTANTFDIYFKSSSGFV